MRERPCLELSLSGDDWRVASFEPGQGVIQGAFADGYPDREAIAAIVPGDVHWDLERSARIPPIYYGTNSQRIGWVAGKEWWYRKSFRTPPATLQGDVVLLWLKLLDAQGRPAVRNLYTFGVQDAQGDTPSPLLAGMQKAPQTKLAASLGAWRHEENGDARTAIEVCNAGDAPALFVKLSVKETPDERVYFEDNFFFLPPRDTRRVRITRSAVARGPAAETPISVDVSAWNSQDTIAKERFV